MSYGYVFDDHTLRELGRADDGLAAFVANLDAMAVRMSVPVIALVVAQQVLSDDQLDFVHGLIRNMEHVQLEAIASLEDSAALTAVATYLNDPPDLSAAHTIAISRLLDFPILAVDLKRWEAIVAQLPWQIELVEITDLS